MMTHRPAMTPTKIRMNSSTSRPLPRCGSQRPGRGSQHGRFQVEHEVEVPVPATLAVTGIAASVGDTPSDPKHQALNNRRTLASLPPGSGSLTYQTPERVRPSSGRQGLQPALTSDESGVLAESVRLLTSYCQLQALPSEVAQRPAAIVDNGPARATAMHTIWSAEVVDQQLTTLNTALNLVANDATYQAYSDCAIVADQATASATVTGLTAAVIFTGHASYQIGASTKNDPDTQWQINLSRPSTASGWSLVSMGQVSLPGGGN